VRGVGLTVAQTTCSTVIVMGAFVLGPSVDQMRDGSGDLEGPIMLGASWDLVALGTATVLSVFKPGNARRDKPRVRRDRRLPLTQHARRMATPRAFGEGGDDMSERQLRVDRWTRLDGFAAATRRVLRLEQGSMATSRRGRTAQWSK
jgi:hypothetical protein